MIQDRMMNATLSECLKLGNQWINQNNSYVFLLRLSPDAKELYVDPVTGEKRSETLSYPEQPLKHTSPTGLSTTLQVDDPFEIEFMKTRSAVTGEKCFEWRCRKIPSLRVYSHLRTSKEEPGQRLTATTTTTASNEHIARQCYRLKFSELKYVVEALLADYGRYVEQRYGWKLPQGSRFDAARLSWPITNAYVDSGRGPAS